MADNFRNNHYNYYNYYNTRKRNYLKIKRKWKNKFSGKRKSDKYFKRKRFIYSLHHKKNLNNMNLNRLAEVFSSSDRCPQNEEIDQVAYWKSRAISLELENQMLHKHIKQMYINTITQNQQQMGYNEDYSTQDMDLGESDNENEENVRKQTKGETAAKKNKSVVKVEPVEEDEAEVEESRPPDTLDVKKNKEEELKHLYGSSWGIIRGMETAVQLTYDHNVARKKAAHWPVVPIKL